MSRQPRPRVQSRVPFKVTMTSYPVADPRGGKGGANAPPPFEELPSRALSKSAQT